MGTKVMRYQLIKPMDCDWSLLGKVIRDLQYDTQQILNKTIQLCWEWQGFSANYKKRYDSFPVQRAFLGYSDISGYAYNRLKVEYTRFNTANLTTSINRAVKRWKADRNDIVRGHKSIASYKEDTPIDLHDKAVGLTKEAGEYRLVVSLASIAFRRELGRTSGQFLILIDPGNKSSRDILDRCIDGRYKISASQLIYKKKKWFLNLAYSFDAAAAPELDPDKILGVDMGIVCPAYMAVCNSLERLRIDGGEIDAFRKQLERRKWELQRQGKYCGQGRIGHGVKTRIEPVNFARERISNFRDTVNHKYSRCIVDFAIKNGCGTIHLENLSGIAVDKTDKFLKNWTYYDLQNKIRYKAEELGITIRFIEPQYTSQRCSRCGHINKENRRGQADFKCLECGFEANADYNAACNIAQSNIECVIKEALMREA